MFDIVVMVVDRQPFTLVWEGFEVKVVEQVNCKPFFDNELCHDWSYCNCCNTWMAWLVLAHFQE